MDSSRYRLREIRPVPRLIAVAGHPRQSETWPQSWPWVGQGHRETERGKGQWLTLWRVVSVALGMVALGLGGLAWFEARTSHFQAKYFTQQAAMLGSTLEDGASQAMGSVGVGPLDERLGYARLPEMQERLQEAGFQVLKQARWSDAMLQAQEEGIFAIYPVKHRAGLVLTDADAAPVYDFKYPQHYYERFEDIPQLLVETLLFIEDRDLLDATQPLQNPAIAPRRLMRAVLDKGLAMLGSERDVAGGSTLATQLEKYSHSPAGRTNSVEEKVRQMRSASLRAYAEGMQTMESRRTIVRNYVNSVPLGARRGRGEVHGIGDGLAVWLGLDFEQVNRVLQGPPPEYGAGLEGYALAYRAVLMMLLAQQRPATFLPDHIDRLDARTDVFLGLLAEHGVISERLRDAALAQRVGIAEEIPQMQVQGALANMPKTLKTWQQMLGNLLGVSGLYALERMDVSAQMTLDVEVQRAVEEILAKLTDPGEVRKRGLRERKRVGYGPADEIVYSVLLVERGQDQVDRVRVQTDTWPDDLDMNQGSMLDLGSTAKLRVLVHYLEIVEALHEELAALSSEELAAYRVRRRDNLTKWAVSYLRRNSEATVAQMLKAAMKRRYSIDPDASFMTGGGEHRFGNVVEIESEDGEEVGEVFLSVSDAFRVSANLPFVRMMSDIVNYHITRLPENKADILENLEDPRRAEYLDRFAGQDARKYVRRSYDRYAGLDAAEMRKTLFRGARWSAADREIVEALLERKVPLEEADFGSTVRTRENAVNPLELFVVRYLLEYPEATLQEVMDASAEIRERSKPWMLWPDGEVHQRRRIRFGLEEDAFEGILQAWQAVGYPFNRMIPSYASALGASADRPTALAELMGTIQAGGVRRPMIRIEEVRFAEGTPYETHFAWKPAAEEHRVMSVEVAEVLQEALADVAKRGTGRHGRWSFRDSEGNRLEVRGKTGTGDNRHRLYNRNGRVVGSRTTNRTATWMFTIGDCLYGTIVAYVPGEEARRHTFMSELVVRVLAELKPALEPLVERTDCGV